jgi:hypothetical protein
VIDDAMDRFMPKSASAATKALAEAVALERAKSGPVSMCRACGVTATQSDPVTCTVCGASDFEVISREMIEKIAAVEGGLQEETTGSPERDPGPRGVAATSTKCAVWMEDPGESRTRSHRSGGNARP